MYHVKMKKEKHVIYLVSAEKAFNKIQHSLLMKTLNKLEVEGDFLIPIKNMKKQYLKSFNVEK